MVVKFVQKKSAATGEKGLAGLKRAKSYVSGRNCHNFNASCSARRMSA